MYVPVSKYVRTVYRSDGKGVVTEIEKLRLGGWVVLIILKRILFYFSNDGKI